MKLLDDLDIKINDLEKIQDNRFRYSYDLGAVDFVFIDQEKKFFDIHNEIWCENKTEFFIVNFEENNEIHICDSKTKPNILNSIKVASIDSFKYGENSPKAQKYMNLLKKKNIDNGECLKNIQQFLNKRKRIPIDKDLLENLKNCRKKIIGFLNSDNAEEIAQKLIDRCLFIRFLEDRADLVSLKNILSNKATDEKEKLGKLLNLFDSYNKKLNGDIFENDDIPRDVNEKIVNELNKIFGKTYQIQRTHQTTLFPYSFKSIPIVLISNIYEDFLSKEKRIKEGIVFTPENIVEYTIKKILKEPNVIDKLKNRKIKILDPTCGSGVFLIKIFEEIIKTTKQLGVKLSLEDKADIILNCIFGIDKNRDALRIAALGLYLKLIEDEKPDIIRKRLFEKSEKHFMFPGLKENKNLMFNDSLFDSVLDGEKFDVIVGNPPWGYDFPNREKQILKNKWPMVADYQSSQYFLLKIKKWMNKETICGIVINLSNFTNSNKFKEYFTRTYYLRSFINLSKVKKITFGPGSEPSCILLFSSKDYLIDEYNKKNEKEAIYNIEFITPELSHFSLLTHIINDSYISTISIDELNRNENLWHIYSLGYDLYLELIDSFDIYGNKLDKFKKRFEDGMMKYSSKSGLTKDQYYKKYRSATKINQNYFPIIDSLDNIEQYFGKKPIEFFDYGQDHLDRGRDINLFKGDKLIITRSWPIKSFIDSNTTLYDSNFYIFKLNNYPKEYLTLFEAVINSTLCKFYLGVKYLLRKEGNYAKVNLEHLKSIPIPELEDKKAIIERIINLVESLKEINDNKKSPDINKIKNEIDDEIFNLYELDYYSIQQIKHYVKLEKEKRKILVTKEDVEKYCEEFIDTIIPFIKDEISIDHNYEISDFFGTMVKFTIVENKRDTFIDNRGVIGNFISIIESQEINEYNRIRIFSEEKIKFYDGNKFYIYKSNKPKDWTNFMAIKDANEEISEFFHCLDVKNNVSHVDL